MRKLLFKTAAAIAAAAALAVCATGCAAGGADASPAQLEPQSVQQVYADFRARGFDVDTPGKTTFGLSADWDAEGEAFMEELSEDDEGTYRSYNMTYSPEGSTIGWFLYSQGGHVMAIPRSYTVEALNETHYVFTEDDRIVETNSDPDDEPYDVYTFDEAKELRGLEPIKVPRIDPQTLDGYTAEKFEELGR